MKTKLFLFDQNNSGGIFDVDQNVCHRVVIEAIDEAHARKIFEPMIENQSDSCPCCGDRWSLYSCEEVNIDKYKDIGYRVGVYSHYKDAETRWFKLYGNYPRIEDPKWVNKTFKEYAGVIYFETVDQYLQYLADEYGWTVPDVRIHYLNGTKKEIFKNSTP